MSDKNIKIIKHIQQYGHPLYNDKITSDYNIMEPKNEQYKKGNKVYEAYQQGRQDMAKELLFEFITIYAALKGTKLDSIKEPKPDIISEGALLFLQQQIEDLLEKYTIK